MRQISQKQNLRQSIGVCHNAPIGDDPGVAGRRRGLVACAKLVRSGDPAGR
jgi:hypothetical protein